MNLVLYNGKLALDISVAEDKFAPENIRELEAITFTAEGGQEFTFNINQTELPPTTNLAKGRHPMAGFIFKNPAANFILFPLKLGW
jgi:hypothetical protein